MKREARVFVGLLVGVWLLWVPGPVRGQQWAKTYGGTDWDWASSIQPTSDGGYIVAGRFDYWPDTYWDVWVLKLDANGNVLWQKTYGGIDYDEADSIQPTADGGFVVAGLTESFGAGASDAWVLKLDANGNIPGCPLVGTSRARVTKTRATVAEPSILVTVPEVQVDSPALTLRDSSASSTEVCVGNGNGICPATAALEGAPQKETKLGVLYAFRDEVLATTPIGERYIELFYTHAVEGVGLMLRYPELRARTRTLLERFLPTLRAILAGKPVTMTPADLAAIEALLQAFAAKASPELQTDLKALQKELRQGTLLEQFGIKILGQKPTPRR